MGVSVVVGGQFGSEGKGKVAYKLAQETGASIALRVGGSNSGHTVVDSSGAPVILRQLPTAALLPGVICALGAGSYINPDILLEEISRTGMTRDRLLIDPNATIISKRQVLEEKNSYFQKSIGSTVSGTGAAVRRRIERKRSVRLAKNEEGLQQFVKQVVPFLRDNLSTGKRVIVEGTQGFGLSLLHSKYYPYVTSRETSTAAFVSEAGLSPLDIDDVVLVIRAFPIRVGGNSGPLPNEIDWETITRESKSDFPIVEYTSVTKQRRLDARFDADIVRQAIMVNQPTHIVLNHLDYVDARCRRLNKLTDKGFAFVEKVEMLIGKSIDYFGFGPASLVERRKAGAKIRMLTEAACGLIIL